MIYFIKREKQIKYGTGKRSEDITDIAKTLR